MGLNKTCQLLAGCLCQISASRVCNSLLHCGSNFVTAFVVFICWISDFKNRLASHKQRRCADQTRGVDVCGGAAYYLDLYLGDCCPPHYQAFLVSLYHIHYKCHLHTCTHTHTHKRRGCNHLHLLAFCKYFIWSVL